jgi:hypothetical protein
MIQGLVLNGMWLGLWGTKHTQETTLQCRNQGQYNGLPQPHPGGVKPALRQEMSHEVHWFDPCCGIRRKKLRWSHNSPWLGWHSCDALQQRLQAWEILRQRTFHNVYEAFLLPEHAMRLILLPKMAALVLQSLACPPGVF